MSKIVGKVKWIAAQCAAVALVAIATNLLESAGAALTFSRRYATHSDDDRGSLRKRQPARPCGRSFNKARASAGMRVSGQFSSEALATQSRRALSHLIREDLQVPSSVSL
jgi:hypothetical protein